MSEIYFHGSEFSDIKIFVYFAVAKKRTNTAYLKRIKISPIFNKNKIN